MEKNPSNSILEDVILNFYLVPVANALFLFIGTIFYTYNLGIGWVQGLYYAVSIGSSIGWVGDFDESYIGSISFSCLYIILGKLVLIYTTIYFTMIFLSEEQWIRAMFDREFKKSIDSKRSHTWYEYFEVKYFNNMTMINVFLLLGIYLVCGMFWYRYYVDSTLLNGLFFFSFSINTCGLYGLDDGSPDWYYVFVSLYTFFGIQLLDISAALIVGSVIKYIIIENLSNSMRAEISEEEKHLLRLLEVGSIQKTEYKILKVGFLLLVLIRLGILNPSTVAFLYKRFDELDRIKEVFGDRPPSLVLGDDTPSSYSPLPSSFPSPSLPTSSSSSSSSSSIFDHSRLAKKDIQRGNNEEEREDEEKQGLRDEEEEEEEKLDLLDPFRPPLPPHFKQ